ncbi:hypothetical protein GQ43DRAFT_485328 [Delitschia confertaspora ATCC 74209]|uniref:Uncharacterized protein n=1 Tax=Delitschia confertaspora ATCC 74209 TaxID=1513339 RepID=A0A9P4MQG2_9PLEO|nr:hypothetical protein GQ43DRAFT_485328 [Delitschia confertaspora ATCC 74209]
MPYTTATTKTGPFSLSSPPDTDIWRKPPSHNVLSAPTHPDPLPKCPLKLFQRARLSFTLPPVPQLLQYDQAGLLLHFTKPGLPEGKDKWLKTGIEFYYQQPYISTVGCDQWADWSIVPLPQPSSSSSSEDGDFRPGIRLEAKRERDELGKSLWVYAVEVDAEGKEVERRPLREVNWAFAEEEEGWEVGVGGYVARPAKEGGELVVEFGEGLEVEVLEG